MSFKRKNDGLGAGHLRYVRYSETTEGLPATPVLHTEEALQRMTINDKTPPPVHQGPPTYPVDVETLADNLRSVRTDLATLLELLNREQCPNTAFSARDFRGHWSEDTIAEKIPIPHRAALEVISFDFKP